METVDCGITGRKAAAGQFEPLLITMEDLQRVLGCGKTMAFAIVSAGAIESVKVGRKRMPLWQSTKAYVERLRDQAKQEAA